MLANHTLRVPMKLQESQQKRREEGTGELHQDTGRVGYGMGPVNIGGWGRLTVRRFWLDHEKPDATICSSRFA